MISYKIIKREEAIKILQQTDHEYIMILTHNAEKPRLANKKEGIDMIQAARTIGYNEDPYVPNMDLFMFLEHDVNKLINQGVCDKLLLYPE